MVVTKEISKGALIAVVGEIVKVMGLFKTNSEVVQAVPEVKAKGKTKAKPGKPSYVKTTKSLEGPYYHVKSFARVGPESLTDIKKAIDQALKLGEQMTDGTFESEHADKGESGKKKG